MYESHARTLLRTSIYRIIVIFVTAIWTGAEQALIITLVLSLIQYVYERAWLKINWGTENK